MTNDGRKALVNFKIGVISYYLANVCALNKNSQIDLCSFPMNVSENVILILVSPSNGSVTPLNILKIIAYTYKNYSVYLYKVYCFLSSAIYTEIHLPV